MQKRWYITIIHSRFFFPRYKSVGLVCQDTERLTCLFLGFVHILLYALGHWFSEETNLSKLLLGAGLFLNGHFSLHTAPITGEAHQYLQKVVVFVTRDSRKQQFLQVFHDFKYAKISQESKNVHLRSSLFKISLPASVMSQFYKISSALDIPVWERCGWFIVQCRSISL